MSKEIGIDNSNPVPLSLMRIDPRVVTILRLNEFGISRNERRKICKEKKIKWDIYQKLQKEVKRRIFYNLNIETGRKIDES